MRCKNCGYVFFDDVPRCPKCDAELEEKDEETLLMDEDTEGPEPWFIEERSNQKQRSKEEKKTPVELKLPLESTTRKIEERRELPASLGLRCAAAFLDLFFITLVSSLTTLLPYQLGGGKAANLPEALPYCLILFSIQILLYFSLFHFLTSTTPGKAIFEIEIERNGERSIPFHLSFLKSMLGFLLTLPLFLTWIYALIGEEEVPLHDRILGTASVEME